MEIGKAIYIIYSKIHNGGMNMQNLNEAGKNQYVTDIIGDQYFTWGNFNSQKKYSLQLLPEVGKVRLYYMSY